MGPYYPPGSKKRRQQDLAYEREMERRRRREERELEAAERKKHDEEAQRLLVRTELEQYRKDIIDIERGRLEGPQAAAEPIATPGLRVGLQLTLDLANAERHPKPMLQRGIVAVAGRLVRLAEPTFISESTSSWLRPRRPAQNYYVYFGLDERIYLDTLEPAWDGPNMVFTHPQDFKRALVGHLWVSLQEDVVFASSRRDATAVVTVASSEFRAPADYTCDGETDETEINVAAKYLIQRFGGGTIRLSAGRFNVASPVFLRGPWVQLQGDGRATELRATRGSGIGDVAGQPRWATDPAAVVNLLPRAPDQYDRDKHGQLTAPLDEGESGVVDTQLRDLTVTSGRPEDPADPQHKRVEQTYYTGWGTRLEQPEAGEEPVNQLRADFLALFKQLEVGPLDVTPADAGAEKLYSDGAKLVMRFAKVGQPDAWLEAVRIEPSVTAAGDPAITLTHVDGSTTTLTAKGLTVPGRVRAGSLFVTGNGAVNGTMNVRRLDAIGEVEGGSLDIKGAGSVAGNLEVTGEVGGATLDIGGNADIDGTLALGDLADVKRAIRNLYAWAARVRTWQRAIDAHTHAYRFQLVTGAHPGVTARPTNRGATDAPLAGPSLGSSPSTPSP